MRERADSKDKNLEEEFGDRSLIETWVKNDSYLNELQSWFPSEKHSEALKSIFEILLRDERLSATCDILIDWNSSRLFPWQRAIYLGFLIFRIY